MERECHAPEPGQGQRTFPDPRATARTACWRRIQLYRLLDFPGSMKRGILYIVLEELFLRIVRLRTAGSMMDILRFHFAADRGSSEQFDLLIREHERTGKGLVDDVNIGVAVSDMTVEDLRNQFVLQSKRLTALRSDRSCAHAGRCSVQWQGREGGRTNTNQDTKRTCFDCDQVGHMKKNSRSGIRMPWKRSKECKEGRSREGGESEDVWRESMEVEDEAESRRKLDEQKKKLQKEPRDVDRLSFVSKRCRRVSWSHCSTSCNRWRQGGMISCLSTRSFTSGHKRYKASRTRGNTCRKKMLQRKKRCGSNVMRSSRKRWAKPDRCLGQCCCAQVQGKCERHKGRCQEEMREEEIVKSNKSKAEPVSKCHCPRQEGSFKVHRREVRNLMKEEMEEQFNKEAKEGRKICG